MSSEPESERIAKRLARAGVASRRVAETMIAEGRVAVNGRVIDSPALNVTETDKITVDGAPLAAAEATRLWRYYKPVGLVTSDRDEKGRDTVFAHLPPEMPRVLSVGRLDISSEGLLLLTNDGELKRRLELPSTGWLRKYRVRAKGEPTEVTIEPLRRGITVDGENFQSMTVKIDRQQGANVWLTIGLREGKNREIRRALEAVGLSVNRLIRLSYGPFQLGELEPGGVEEVRPKILREQLGIATASHRPDAPAGARAEPDGGAPRGPATARPGAGRPAAGKPGPARPGTGKPGMAKAGPGKPGGTRSGPGKPGPGKPGLPKPTRAAPGGATKGRAPTRSGAPSPGGEKKPPRR